jgi:putative transposase
LGRPPSEKVKIPTLPNSGEGYGTLQIVVWVSAIFSFQAKNLEGALPLAAFAKGGVFRPLVFPVIRCSFPSMPWSLRRFHQTRQLHFITFSCYRRQPRLGTPEARCVFEQQLEIVRRRFQACVYGYVVMPEHVHLLVSEPEGGPLSSLIQSLKQTVARRLGFDGPHFWQRRYYDFNVWGGRKLIEKLRYIHRNPLTRGLADKPEDWSWSSFRHYLYGEEGIVEIESEWTMRKREKMGTAPPLAKPAKGRAP